MFMQNTTKVYNRFTIVCTMLIGAESVDSYVDLFTEAVENRVREIVTLMIKKRVRFFPVSVDVKPVPEGVSLVQPVGNVYQVADSVLADFVNSLSIKVLNYGK